jgi:hypothetical protein
MRYSPFCYPALLAAGLLLHVVSVSADLKFFIAFRAIRSFLLCVARASVQ